MKRVLFLLAAALAVAGCATSRGSLFRDTAETERKQAVTIEKQQEPVEPVEEEEQWEEEYYEETVEQSGATEGLEILSYPDGAEVYLDGRYGGTTPLLLPDLPWGRYRLTLRKEGYHTYTTWIAHLSRYSVYNLQLQPITGFLRLEVKPRDASVTVGFRQYAPGRVHEIQVGRYFVTARSFGYRDASATVVIRERELTELSLTLPEAQFSVEDLRLSRSRFNPRNPGDLGAVRLSFEVTSFGSAAAVILDEDGQEVYQKTFDRFTTWRQELSWTGRRTSGEIVPDGQYTIRLRAVGEKEGTVVEREAAVRVDYSLVLAYRSLASGSAGLVYAPSPEVLFGGGLQLSTLVLAHWESDRNGSLVRIPVILGSRWGISGRQAGDFDRAPFSRWELDVQAGSTVGYSDDQGEESLTFPFFASAALKTPLASPRGNVGFGLAAQAKLAYQGVSTDTLANSSGLSLGMPAALQVGSVTLLAEPELIVSPWRVSYDPAASREAGFYSWLYARTGLLVDLGVLTAGLSLSARTVPFSEGFAIDLPFQAAVELSWLIPGTSLVLSGVLAGEFSPPDSYYLQGGAGLGLLH